MATTSRSSATTTTLKSLTSSAKEEWAFKKIGLTNGHYFIRKSDLKAYLTGEATAVPIRPLHAEHGEVPVQWTPQFYIDPITNVKWFGDGACLLWFEYKGMSSLKKFAGVTQIDSRFSADVQSRVAEGIAPFRG